MYMPVNKCPLFLLKNSRMYKKTCFLNMLCYQPVEAKSAKLNGKEM